MQVSQDQQVPVYKLPDSVRREIISRAPLAQKLKRQREVIERQRQAFIKKYGQGSESIFDEQLKLAQSCS